MIVFSFIGITNFPQLSGYREDFIDLEKELVQNRRALTESDETISHLTDLNKELQRRLNKFDKRSSGTKEKIDELFFQFNQKVDTLDKLTIEYNNVLEQNNQQELKCKDFQCYIAKLENEVSALDSKYVTLTHTNIELALPAVYQQTAKGEQFLLYDSGAGDVHRFLIFGTQHNLRMLRRSKIWLADGSLKTAHPLFAQVYVVHGLHGGDDPMKTGHLLPSLFVLLPNKTEVAYLKMWEQIPLLCPLAQPQQMLLDFEKGVITSFEHVWPNTVVKCCFFHLTQNIWRHVQSAYTHDEELAMRIRRIPALAFARPAGVPDLFDQVAMDLPLRLR
ncbi:hypothetical protein LOD99_4009 [Oopsacas minuta]|uniref:MULE transposase domain-containing protein n=1 Tax=Oopsacas minuta TaxID=111878 RepID=A0AAV7JVT7_9METZ|nr:hypothetical protein LOD99_4009 [Oopsacas minuta]